MSQSGEGHPSTPDFLRLAAIGLLVFSPLALVIWAGATALLRLTGFRWWQVAISAGGGLVLAVVVAGGVTSALAAHFGWLATAAGQLEAGRAIQVAVSAALVSQVPLALPVGLLAASVTIATSPAGELDPLRQRQTAKQAARQHHSAARLADQSAAGPALAVSIDGDLDDWRRGRLIIPPARILGLPRAVIGMPGFGKSVMLEREVYLAAHAGRRVAVFDGKGSDPSFAPGIIAAYLTARPDAKVGLFPHQPIDIWRGGPRAVANRLLACWAFTPEAEFYAQVAALALRLALEAPKAPPVTHSVELARRLMPGVLKRLWLEHPDEEAYIKGLESRLPDVALRLGNLLAALGDSMNGSWSFEDVDLAVVTVPTMAAPADADAILRILLVDYGHYTLARKRAGELDTLIFDEFSAIQGGRQAAINLVERARGSGSGAILAAQSRRALGTEEEAARILHACSGGVTLFRSAEPEDVARLAGTRLVADRVWQLEDDHLTGRGAVAMRPQPRLDPNQVRAFSPGEAAIIEGGRVEHVRIIRTAPSPETQARAHQLVAAARRPDLSVPTDGPDDLLETPRPN